MLRRYWPDILIACVIFAVCLAVYNSTLTPSLSYKSPDGNELATIPYWLVYDVRPDVAMPHLPHANPRPGDLAGRKVYTTIRLDSREAGRGPGALPRNLVSPDAWHVPVLFGSPGESGSGPGIRPLVLYHVTGEAPKLIVADAEPQVEMGEEAAGWVLVGYDLEKRKVRTGTALHLTLYWRGAAAPQRVLVSTLLKGTALEIHEPGMGNLSRYIQEFHPPRDGVLVEDYQVVVPRTTEAGTATLSVGIGFPFRLPGGEAEWEAVLDLGEVTPLRDHPLVRLGSLLLSNRSQGAEHLTKSWVHWTLSIWWADARIAGAQTSGQQPAKPETSARMDRRDFPYYNIY